MSSRDRPDPSSFTPREAVQRYLQRRRADATEQSVESWWYRLKLFVEWCEGVGITEVGDLTGYDLDEYYGLRSERCAPATLDNEMQTLKNFLEFLEQLEAVEAGFAERVRKPDVDEEDLIDHTQLTAVDAIPLLRYYRSTPSAFGTRAHVFLELAWTVGARQGGLRALDVRDVHVDDRYLEFVHRPESGTPLKRKREGERPVALLPDSVEPIRRYLDHHRHDVHDEHGRAPFLASMKGRPGLNTIRVWSYLATEPCLYGPCPHDRERETCEYTERAHASKCPSSRSPHQIRTGSITWQLNQGLPPAVVAERVNAELATIKSHYDKATDLERRRRQLARMERDRRPFVDALDLDADEHGDTES